MDEQNRQPRARRADRHREEAEQLPPQATRRAGFPPEDEAPLPIGGYDAARPAQRPVQRPIPGPIPGPGASRPIPGPIPGQGPGPARPAPGPSGPA